ncbi:MAG: hypothetical protein R3208_10070 [Ketobacteraceae bacterium]|nr:hypothetical protein [Ketobacteraceae bacterium]
MNSTHSTDYFHTQKQVTVSGNRPVAADQPGKFLRALLGSFMYEVAESALKTVSGAGFAALLITYSGSNPSVLAAAAGGSALLYLASLSGARSARDVFAMIIPATAILGLLLLCTGNPDANGSTMWLGYALLLHVSTSFYGSLNHPAGALSEMRLWPLLLAFHATLMAGWAALVA